MDDEALRAAIEAKAASGDSYEHYNALPFWVVTTYGARGYGIHRGEPSDEGVHEAYFELDALPERCPFPKDLTSATVVDRLWAPLAPKIPKFVGALAERCKIVIALERTSGTPAKKGWFLLYFLDRGTDIPSGNGRYKMLTGRAPMRRPKLNRRARKAGFTLPESLRSVYNVHNGVGFSGAVTYGVEALLSAKMLAPLPLAPKLLEVYCDSGGNRKAFLKGEDALADWDRSTHQRTREGSLWRLFEGELLRYVTGADE